MLDDEKLFDTARQLEIYEAVGKIDRLRVSHSSFAAALTGIKSCIMASVHSREPVNCMLLGEGGAGKTSLAEHISKLFPPEVIREDDVEVRTVPAFYTSFKSARTLDALTTDILIKLGDPHPAIGKLGDKANRVLALLISCRTKVVFIDELHDLEDIESNKSKFLKWVKEVTNACGPVVCLMGLEHCGSLFSGDSEMSRRFKHTFILRRLSMGSKDQMGELSPFMIAICRAIMNTTPIKSFPPLGRYEHVLQVWAATRGSPDFIMSMLKEAVLRALLANRQEVTLEDIASVWDAGLLRSSSVLKFNPFTATQAQIVTAIRKWQA